MKAKLITVFFCVVFAACQGKQSNTADKHLSDIDTILLTTGTKTPETKSDTLTYYWEDDLCGNTGYYLASQYTKEEIEATYELWQRGYAGLNDYVSVFKPQDIEKIDIPKFTKEYNQMLAYLDHCQPVDIPFWKEYVVHTKEFIKKFYYLKKLELEAFHNPAVLLTSQYKNDDCNPYAKAVASDDTELLRGTWETWSKEMSKKNASPDRYMEQFYQKYHSADWRQYALVDLISFAWWNCVNPYSVGGSDYGKYKSEFEKLFVRIERECDEP